MPLREAVVGDVVGYRNADGETVNVIVTGVQSAAPAAGDFTVNAADTGGELEAGTYSYKVTVVTGGNESPASVAEADTVGAVVVGSVEIDFTVGLASFPAATAWKVYGRTADDWLLIATVAAPTATYTDTGEVTPAGEPPTDDGSVAFRNRGTKTTQGNIPVATTVKSVEAYFKR